MSTYLSSNYLRLFGVAFAQTRSFFIWVNSICTSLDMGRAKRFFLHWLMFALYVILCSALVMVIEGGEQYNRQTKRMNLENEINETKNLIYRYFFLINHKNFRPQHERFLFYRTVSHLISKTDEDQNKFLFNTDFSNRSECKTCFCTWCFKNLHLIVFLQHLFSVGESATSIRLLFQSCNEL